MMSSIYSAVPATCLAPESCGFGLCSGDCVMGVATSSLFMRAPGSQSVRLPPPQPSPQGGGCQAGAYARPCPNHRATPPPLWGRLGGRSGRNRRGGGSIVSLPLAGRGQGWGSCHEHRASGSTPTRLPPPSPQGGGATVATSRKYPSRHHPFQLRRLTGGFEIEPPEQVLCHQQTVLGRGAHVADRLEIRRKLRDRRLDRRRRPGLVEQCRLDRP